MNLQELYFQIKNNIDSIDFSLLWSGFSPLKFALYDEHSCFFDGKYIDKTDDFVANTSIFFRGEYIAIWQVNQAINAEILTSKIIHEMFHAFQNLNGESRFPNEMDSLLHYRYSEINLSIKAAENRLLAHLMEQFDPDIFQRFLRLRNYRRQHFSYELNYEAAIEQIEGSATYVELASLKQLSPIKYQQRISKILSSLRDESQLFPIRIFSYEIGAVLFLLAKEQNLSPFENFSSEPFPLTLLRNVTETEIAPLNSIVQQQYHSFKEESNEIIRHALELNHCICDKESKLLGINVYDARYEKPHIISRYFVMYEDEDSTHTVNGNFVIELSQNQSIKRIYQF